MLTSVFGQSIKIYFPVRGPRRASNKTFSASKLQQSQLIFQCPNLQAGVKENLQWAELLFNSPLAKYGVVVPMRVAPNIPTMNLNMYCIETYWDY